METHKGGGAGGAEEFQVSGSGLLISHSSKGSRRPGPLLGKDAFHGCCLHQISSLKPAGDKGDLEKTNSSEKSKQTQTPKQRLSQFSGETWIRQVTWLTTFLQSLGDFFRGNLFQQLCNFDFQLIRFVLFGRLG